MRLAHLYASLHARSRCLSNPTMWRSLLPLFCLRIYNRNRIILSMVFGTFGGWRARSTVWSCMGSWVVFSHYGQKQANDGLHFHLIEYHSKNILRRFCSNVMKQTHLTGCRHWSTKTFLFNIKHSNKMKIFNEHTLITIIGPTALISYARSKDDFSTLVNVVSVLQIEEYDWLPGFNRKSKIM